MTYTPKEWETGDIIGASDLNNIENGIVSVEAMKLTYTVAEGTYTLNKTWQEIHDAIATKFMYIVITWPDDPDQSTSQISEIAVYIDSFSESNKYTIGIGSGTGLTEFKTDSADGYPTWTYNQ